MPSIASLAKQQYYGHPQNAFWRIMGRLFGAGPEMHYDERKRILCEQGIAVWDVLREGSAKARERAQETMALVRDAMKIDFPEFRR